MRINARTLVLATVAALMTSGAVIAQDKGVPYSEGSGPSTSGPGPLIPITGQTCTGTPGSTNCPFVWVADTADFVSTFDVENCDEITDVDVGIDQTHTFVGDLIYTVTSPGGPPVIVISQPTSPAGGICAADNIEAVLDDGAATSVQTECAAADPTIDGFFMPANPLAAFNGLGGNGTWQIRVQDVLSLDVGTFNDWSLDLSCISRADLDVTVVENSTPVIVLPGSSDYTFTITNNGPDDATNVVATMGFGLIGGPLNGACVRTVSQGVEPTSPTWAWDVGNIDSGNTATIREVCPIDASSGEGTRTVSLTTTSLDQVDPTPGNNSAAEDTVFVRSASWRISKVWDGGSVPVELNCSDGASYAGDTPVTLTHTGFADGVTCIVTETVVPDGFFPTYSAGCDVSPVVSGVVHDCTITNGESIVRFHVTKEFSDGEDFEVDVAIECNDGLPSSDSATITGGDLAGHTFVVGDFIDGAMDCEITESGGPDGYEPSPSCVFEDVTSATGTYECAFGNEALAGEYTVTKQWFIYNEGGDFVNENVRVTIACDREIFNKGAERIDGTWFLSRRLGDGESMTASVRTERRPNRCMASENIRQSGVESESEGNCDWHEIGAGETSACTFINTVFFEGIPTLSQYGLAILALLMLGVGMVGFRRFV